MSNCTARRCSCSSEVLGLFLAVLTELNLAGQTGSDDRTGTVTQITTGYNQVMRSTVSEHEEQSRRPHWCPSCWLSSAATVHHNMNLVSVVQAGAGSGMVGACFLHSLICSSTCYMVHFTCKVRTHLGPPILKGLCRTWF